MALTAALAAAALPAALLIGPLLAAIGVGRVESASLRVPLPIFTVAQGLIGCLVASSLTPAVLAELARDWGAVLFGASAVIVASGFVGWACARFGSIAASTAAWGSCPGAASAMVAMADEMGADPQLVAIMQYLRVICVVLAASLVSRALLALHPELGEPPSAYPTLSLSGGNHALDVGVTIGIAVIGSALGRAARIPAGGLLIPLAVGALAASTGLVRIAIPPWALALAYAALGWSIGLRLGRLALVRAARLLPAMTAAALATMALCGASALILVKAFGVPPLSAYLATSPGGIDAVAAIALSSGADAPFVMALQTVRVLLVVVTGPVIARAIARSTTRSGSSRGPAAPR